MMKTATRITLLFLACLLSACGQSGMLYLPGQAKTRDQSLDNFIIKPQTHSTSLATDKHGSL